ncbi:MAG: flagellar basal body P-ring formation protein FlgA [Nitrospirae bacterium]|nr:flagellar basal body P-ring formation protein FlgA [Nitrospirota bacterium]
MDTIKKAVQAELVHSVSENVELSGIRIIRGLEALEEGKLYTVGSMQMDGYNGRNRIVYLAALYDDRKTVHNVRVEATYDVLVDVFVAAKPLSSGTIITEDEVYAVRQKNSRLSAGTITDISEIKGRKLKSNIAQGVILRSDQFANSSNIKKGKEVIVLVEGSNVLVSTKGVLGKDAAIGGTAQVICSSPKKEINGILISADTVKVKI